MLRECINKHVRVVEHRGNDTSMILKRKDAWKEIRGCMLAAGYDREIPKLKQQWVRMKVSARKSVAHVRKTSLATGNCVPVPKLSEEDDAVHGMIEAEFLVDEILIDCDTASIEMNEPEKEEDLNCTMPSNQNDSCKGTAGDVQPTTSKAACSHITRLRNLPKNTKKVNIIEERQRQIAMEAAQSEEMHLLKKANAKAEIEHQCRMHTKKEEYLELKCEFVRQEIQHEKRKNANAEELHLLQVALLRKQINKVQSKSNEATDPVEDVYSTDDLL